MLQLLIKRKSPQIAGCRMSYSGRPNIGGFFALRTRTSLKRDPLVFFQALEAIALNILEMRKQVATTSIGSDKSEALCVIEPLYCAGLCCHVALLGGDGL
jgi:hypothetical protein